MRTCTYTVEPPNKGHLGEMAFVPCREAVPISEACLFPLVSPFYTYIMKNKTINKLNVA